MRKIFLVLAILLATSGCSLASHEATLLETLPEPVVFQPPLPEEWELPNGIRVLFLKDDELPVIRGTLYFRAGTLWENDLKPGVFSALGTQLRLGGTESLDPDSLDSELEKMSAAIGASVGAEFGNVSFGCLSPDIEKVLKISSDIIRKPRFDKDRFSLWQGQMLEGIRRRGDAADTVASIAAQQLLFPDSPIGRILVDTDVQALTREDLFEAHARVINPKGALLAVSGDIDREELNVLLTKYFGNWHSDVTREFPDLEKPNKPHPGIYFVRMPFAQASVFVTEHGATRLTPDYPAIDGFNAIFGAGGEFGSALVKRVRTELGLVYSVAGGIFTGMPVGKNFIGLQTKASTTGEALSASLGVLESLRSGDIPQEMLDDAKRGIENSFVFKFDTVGDLVQRRALLSLLNFPETYDDTYVSKINDLTVGDVQEVANKRWDLDDLIIIVIGNDEAFRSLAELRKDGPQYLQKLPFREVTFDQKLVL